MNIKFIYSVILGCTLSTASAQTLTPVFKEVDCGQILFRNSTSFTVELRNNTAQTVRIKEVDTGCGCTAADYDKGDIMPGGIAKIKLTFDGKQLGYFFRTLRVTDSSSSTPAEINLRGQVVSKLVNYSGDYPCKLGVLLTDVDNIEFDDVNKGQRLVQEMHIMNPTNQNVQPTALRLPPYLKVETYPAILGPKQKGLVTVTLKSNELRDYGLTQTSFYLAKNPSDKVSADKEITVSAVLLPPAVAKDDISRPYAARLTMSADELDMTALARKSKAKGEIIITNNGRSVLNISKLQMFTSGLEVQLGKALLEPGESTKLKVTGYAKELRKSKRRPRIIMITNDPDRQKVIITIKK
ncbi:MAG: DUF1573 domain-containing protein [Prevotellaceae bacterium]|nr:DUF1573 domain-containing protein [Prevotellaceae bacterium]